jgi:hypothetical protein
LHVHLIPDENKDLLNKVYKCIGLDMEKTWRNNIKDQSKYLTVKPKNLLRGINNKKFAELIKYLDIRY